MNEMIWTRRSLYYLSTYQVVTGLALLFAPTTTLRLLLSNGDYGDIMPRLVGMLIAGLGISVAWLIGTRAESVYPVTLVLRTFFLISFLGLYWLSRDPLFLVLAGVVGVGYCLTIMGFVADRRGGARLALQNAGAAAGRAL
ncbi:MAG: hypothetical protein ACRDU5_03420 [Mycobacterium sp.]